MSSGSVTPWNRRDAVDGPFRANGSGDLPTVDRHDLTGVAGRIGHAAADAAVIRGPSRGGTYAACTGSYAAADEPVKECAAGQSRVATCRLSRIDTSADRGLTHSVASGPSGHESLDLGTGPTMLDHNGP